MPEPTSYSGTNLIKLEQFCETYFKPSVKEKPSKSIRTPLKDIDFATAKSAVLSSMKTGFSNKKLLPNIKLWKMGLDIFQSTKSKRTCPDNKTP